MTVSQQTDQLALRFGKTVWNIPAQGAASIEFSQAVIADVDEAVDQALRHPADFASVDAMIVPGDQVALAVDPLLPSLPKLVGSVARWLIENGTASSSLKIVMAGSKEQADQLEQHLQQLGMSDTSIERHDPDDANNISYVAADQDAKAIYLNRSLVDADVVIPICCARNREAIDYLGAFSLYPIFSNRETRGELYSFSRLANPKQHQHLIDRSNQAAWWLGLLVGIQVVPSVNDNIAAVICGTLETADKLAQAQLTKSHSQATPPTANPTEPLATAVEAADLVIACIESNSADWQQLARALCAANKYCLSGGSIVLCTDMDQTVGPSLNRLRDVQSSREQIARRLSKDMGDDALAAGAIFEMTRDNHVYLISHHRSQTIENLGLGVISNQEELIHLVRNHSRYIVIQAAQHA
jgi:Lactate racemase N-terminal domain